MKKIFLSVLLFLSFIIAIYSYGFHYPYEIWDGNFPGDYSFNGSVNFTDANVTGLSSGGGSIPSGMIAMFAEACPSGWSTYTAMQGRFPRGEPTSNASSLDTGGSDDAIVVSHSHDGSSLSTSNPGSHTHGGVVRSSSFNNVNDQALASPRYYTSAGSTGGGGSHTHSISGSTGSTGSAGTDANIPAYQEVIYCVKD